MLPAGEIPIKKDPLPPPPPPRPPPPKSGGSLQVAASGVLKKPPIIAASTKQQIKIADVTPEKMRIAAVARAFFGGTEIGHLSQKQSNRLAGYNIIKQNPLYEAQKVTFENFSELSEKENKMVGVMVGGAAADALGCLLEFIPYDPKGYAKENDKIDITPEGFTGLREDMQDKSNVFKLRPGQWSDDTSMALCLAESLMQNEGLDGMQLMHSFMDWWYEGYNTPFEKEENRMAIGLGGNISKAFEAFIEEHKDKDSLRELTMRGDYETKYGDINTSGNGSLMRNGCIGIYAKSLESAEDLAWKQSKVTHQGNESAGCCKLMANLIYKAIHEGASKEKLFEGISDFTCGVPTVDAIAKNEGEWDWKNENFSFNKKRLKDNANYIGSYAPDALAMALHCIYTTSNFEDAVRKAACKGGDSDTVGTITAQIAGAIYGARSIPEKWVRAVEQWDGQGEIAARARILGKAGD